MLFDIQVKIEDRLHIVIVDFVNVQRETAEQPAFTRAEMKTAKTRGETMRQFIEKFRTDEISEEDIWAECEAVRQEMYEERQQAR